jgi:Icc protein
MSLRFLQVTDHHLGTDAAAVNRGYATAWALERVLDAIAAAGSHDADFLLCSGDLVNVGSDAEYAFARRCYGIEPAGAAPGPLTLARAGLAGLPAYFVPGNHDPRDVFVRNLFPDTAPAAHLDLSWQVGDVEFVFLDMGTSGRMGVLRDASLELLDTVLARGRPTVVVLHHHPVEVGIPWLDEAVPEGIDRLWERLQSSQVLGVLFGHTHASVEREVHGVPILGLRSTCFQFAALPEPTFVMQPLHYRLITVGPGTLTSQLYEVPLDGAAEGSPL